MDIAFHDQVVLITGATRGMGKAFADAFEEAGAHLLLTGTNQEHVDALNEESTRRGSTRKYYAVDFTDANQVDRFAEEIRQHTRIDACINNAAINRLNAIDEVTTRDLDDMIAVNVRAPLLITQAASDVMMRNHYGRIVNVGSIFGVVSKPRRTLYSLTKFGISGLTTGSAVELARHDILVNTVSPGFVMTELTTRNLSKEEMATLAEQVPMERFAEPEEIAKVVLFLASSQNSYLTAQNIVVDGGFTHV